MANRCAWQTLEPSTVTCQIQEQEEIQKLEKLSIFPPDDEFDSRHTMASKRHRGTRAQGVHKEAEGENRFQCKTSYFFQTYSRVSRALCTPDIDEIMNKLHAYRKHGTVT